MDERPSLRAAYAVPLALVLGLVIARVLFPERMQTFFATLKSL